MLVAVLSFVGLAGTALADPIVGPGGSTESGGQVTCGTSTKPGRILGIHVYNDGGGAEVCSDNGPLQGRVALGASPGILAPLETPDYVLIQGDNDNPIFRTRIYVQLP
jgi:hypothetical protein